MVTATYNSYKDSVIDRDAILRAFKVLRKDKVLARANHWCCQSCGGSDLEGRMKTKLKDGTPKWKGYAFWHNQGESRAFGYGYNPCLNIYYVGTKDLVAESTHSDSGLTSEEIGYEIYHALTNEGLTVLWDGNCHNSISVYPQVFNVDEEMGLGSSFSGLNPDSPLILDNLRERIRLCRNEWLSYVEKRDKEMADAELARKGLIAEK